MSLQKTPVLTPVKLKWSWFLHNTCGYWEFSKMKNINIFDENIFYGPCAPCETTKHGYWFKIDDKAFQKYKTIQSNQRY